MSTPPYCVTCGEECGSHNCKICGKPCHAIEPCCQIKHGGMDMEEEMEEGFGAAVTCKKCCGVPEVVEEKSVGTTSKEESESVQGRRVVDKEWWKKKRGNSSVRTKVGDSKKKVSKTVPDTQTSFRCIECFSHVLNGTRQENTSEITRKNPSSIQRHKERWHKKGEGNEKCTIVPSDAKQIFQMRNKVSECLGGKTVNKNEKKVVSSTSTTMEGDKNGNNGMKGTPDSDIEMGSIESESEADTEDKMVTKPLQSTLLDFMDKTSEPSETSNASISDVLSAISGLSIKIDTIGSRYKTMEREYFEEYDRSSKIALENIKKAENIHDLNGTSGGILEFFYDEDSGEGILRCNPCYKLHIKSKPALSSLYPRDALKILCKTGTGSLATGLLLNEKKTKLLIDGHNDTWYHHKSQLLMHLRLVGEGSSVHKKALEAYRKEQKIQVETRGIVENIFRAAITDIKLGAAGIHLETLLAFLSECSVNIGEIGHSRKHLPDILHCVEKVVDARVASFLNTPLLSTQLPPFFWVTCDKATPSRTTNQAILIVARDDSGTPCPIPVDAPKVYSNVSDGTYASLAEMITTSLTNKFGESVLPHLVGVSADGPYQTASFRNTLMEVLGLHDDGLGNDQLAFPACWDGAHNVNLGVTDILKDSGSSGLHLNRFIKRCNVFNTILSRGKGYACLEKTEEDFLRPISFARQRFASSSFRQWVNIEKSYASYWKAFELIYPVRIEEEELQYQIAGYDFILDLLAFLDTFEPIVNLMLRLQSLDTPIWKLKSWWPAVKKQMELHCNGLFPKIAAAEIAAAGELRAGSSYKSVTLLDGWLFQCEDNNNGVSKVFTWKERSPDEVKSDHTTFATDLLNSVDARVQSVTSGHHLKILQVFDASCLVELHCGTNNKRIIPDGDYEEYGVEECNQVLRVLRRHQHIEECGIDFDSRLAHRYMLGLKDAIGAGIYNGHCQSWFRDNENKEILLNGASVIELSKTNAESLFESMFIVRLNDGREGCYRLHEQSVYASFYADKDIFSIAKPPTCAILDFVLSKGPEAIAESFYSTMRAQQQSGGQDNDVLARRTKLSWCLPSLKLCRDIIREAGKTYIDGDVVKAHKVGTLFSGRGKSYGVSKVVDRIDTDAGRCPFLA